MKDFASLGLRVDCAICGEAGVAVDSHTVMAGWNARLCQQVVHSDPNVCRDNLQAQRQKLEKEDNHS